MQQRELNELIDLRQQIAQLKSASTALQQSLHRSEIRYQALVEDQADLICRFKPDGRLTFVNAAYCRYFNKTVAELMHQSFMPLIPDEERAKVQQAMAEITAASPVAQIAHRVTEPNGQQRQFHWINRGIYDEANQLIEYQAVGRDISAEVEARSRLDRRTRQLNHEAEPVLNRSHLEKLVEELISKMLLTALIKFER